MRNQVSLIAYADRFGGTLPGLLALLEGPLAGLFGGVHLLPFYTPFDGADAGFDPEDHSRVDPRLGTWEDVARLAAGHDVAADLVVNHVSTRGPVFRRAIGDGRGASEPGLVLGFDAVFPGGASAAELLALFRPRPGLPFTPVVDRDGARHLVWTTFTPEQADLDVGHPAARAYLHEVLERLAEAGVRLVRLDAVGYAVKRRGTSCFMLPETFAFIDELVAEARALGLEVLVEVHGHHALQSRIARHADWVYDFALPPLVLHGLFTGDALPLRRWLDVRPANAVTVLDTHDGIGVVDVAAADGEPGSGLLEPAQIDALVQEVHRRSGGGSRRATGAAAANVDLYQLNCTFFDALGGDDARYELARALQLFVPGHPQVYYVGLLVGANDLALLERTGVGRDVNRHHYTPGELEAALERPVVRRLLELIRLRSTHPAFDGACAVDGGPGGRLTLAWSNGADRATLEADLAGGEYALQTT